MKWVIAIIAAVLASAVQAQEQTAAPEVKYATGTLDYENVGEHDCKPGIAVPVRFVAKNVELKLNILSPKKTVTLRKGGERSVVEIGDEEPATITSFPDRGFLLDVDVTLCISPMATYVSSGRWKIWHESGEADLEISGNSSSEGSMPKNLILSRGGLDNNTSILLFFDGRHKQAIGNNIIGVSAQYLDFPRLRRVSDSFWYLINTSVKIELKPANTSEVEDND